MFIVEVTYQKGLEAIDAHLKAHHAFLDALFAKKILLASGPQNPRKGGIIIASGKLGKEGLEAALADDPFLANGLASYRFIEFSPNKSLPELAGLL
jgi:uncharacterized protein YciI